MNYHFIDTSMDNEVHYNLKYHFFAKVTHLKIILGNQRGNAAALS